MFALKSEFIGLGILIFSPKFAFLLGWYVFSSGLSSRHTDTHRYVV